MNDKPYLDQYFHPGRDQGTGLTLRDYFAAQAMQALILSYDDREVFDAVRAADSAYHYADAMLERRQRP